MARYPLIVAFAASLAVSAVADDASISGADGELPPVADAPVDNSFWHALPKDMQHTLATLLERHESDKSAETLQDPGVDALLSNLLHDELVDRQDAAEASAAQFEAELAAEAAQFEEEDRQRQRLFQEQAAKRRAELEEAEEEQRAAKRAEAEKQRLEHEAAMQRIKEEAAKRHQAQDAIMEEHHRKMVAHQEQHAALQKRHEEHWNHISSILQQVHTGLEDLTGGWRDAPFFDDFLGNTTVSESWKQLALSHLQAPLSAVGLEPSHSVLFLEPKQAGLAERLAAALREQHTGRTLAQSFGDEGEEAHDLVVEVGLLDAMAMGQQNAEEGSRLQALRKAATRLAALVKPGGSWLSVSVVPPALRAPLLGRLASAKFAVPSEDDTATTQEGTGVHTISLPPSVGSQLPEASSGTKALRGSSSTASQVANLLLYGSNEVQVWAYRLHRQAETPDDNGAVPRVEDVDLSEMIRQQRPGTRDDL